MANIQQAAKWMADGKKVHRSVMSSWVLGYTGSYVMLMRVPDPVPAVFELDDLLADDWEISQ